VVGLSPTLLCSVREKERFVCMEIELAEREWVRGYESGNVRYSIITILPEMTSKILLQQ
jgi:hypothetical protein